MITFESLKIERHTWGEHKGQITAELKVKGHAVEMTVMLPQEVTRTVLCVAADAVAAGASEQARAFREEFLTALKDGEPKQEGAKA
jgi:hypothetical protein